MYKCVQNWTGSPDGLSVYTFEKNEVLEPNDKRLSGSLIHVALNEGWIVELKEEKAKPAPKNKATTKRFTKRK